MPKASERRITMTKAAIAALPIHEKRTRYLDARVPGLALYVHPSGAKAWYLYRRVDGRMVERRLGDAITMGVDEARRRAELEARAPRGGAAPPITVGNILDWWLEHYGSKRRQPGVSIWYAREVLAQLRDTPMRELTRAQVRELHAELPSRLGYGLRKGGKKGSPGVSAANKAIQVLSVAINKAIIEGLFDGTNVATHIKMHREEARSRRLSREEAARFLRLAAEDRQPWCDVWLLLLYTGARRSNVMAMRWEDLDLERGEWRIPLTKNGKPHLVPLEAHEVAILHARRLHANGPWVFPAPDVREGHLMYPQHAWGRLCKRAGLEGLRIHDLRRSLASFMVDTGASLPVIGSTLGHLSQASTAIYARLSLEPVREAKRRAHLAMRPPG